jgi:hypothetical protein
MALRDPFLDFGSQNPGSWVPNAEARRRARRESGPTGRQCHGPVGPASRYTRTFGVEVTIFEIHRAEDIAPAFEALKNQATQPPLIPVAEGRIVGNLRHARRGKVWNDDETADRAAEFFGPVGSAAPLRGTANVKAVCEHVMALALTDAQLRLVMTAAQPLPHDKRSAFLERVAAHLGALGLWPCELVHTDSNQWAV